MCQVSLLNAPLIRISFSVSIHSDRVRLADDKNRFKVVLPDQLLESVFSGYYEVRVVLWCVTLVPTFSGLDGPSACPCTTASISTPSLITPFCTPWHSCAVLSGCYKVRVPCLRLLVGFRA
jgi:hypothetical protein